MDDWQRRRRPEITWSHTHLSPSASMAEVAAPPAPDAMEDVVAEVAAAAEPEAPAVPEEPEYISETLYIQNLNEKIKIDGIPSFFSV